MSLIEPIQPITMDNIFKRQDEFLAKMIEAYNNGAIPAYLEPYFAWKKGAPLFGKEQCNAMWQKVREQLYTLYDHVQPEDRLLTDLEAIEAELSRIAMYLK